MEIYNKYIKYKTKYTLLKNQIGGLPCDDKYLFSNTQYTCWANVIFTILGFNHKSGDKYKSDKNKLNLSNSIKMTADKLYDRAHEKDLLQYLPFTLNDDNIKIIKKLLEMIRTRYTNKLIKTKKTDTGIEMKCEQGLVNLFDLFKDKRNIFGAKYGYIMHSFMLALIISIFFYNKLIRFDLGFKKNDDNFIGVIIASIIKQTQSVSPPIVNFGTLCRVGFGSTLDEMKTLPPFKCDESVPGNNDLGHVTAIYKCRSDYFRYYNDLWDGKSFHIKYNKEELDKGQIYLNFKDSTDKIINLTNTEYDGDYKYINATSVSFVELSEDLSTYKENIFYTLFNTEVESNTATIDKWKKLGYTYDESKKQWTSDSIKKVMQESGLIWCDKFSCWMSSTLS